MPGQRATKTSGRFGTFVERQSRFAYDFNLRTHKTLLEKLDYCHKNPLTRALVDRAEDWPWSSYRFYEFGDESVLKMDWDGSWPIIW